MTSAELEKMPYPGMWGLLLALYQATADPVAYAEHGDFCFFCGEELMRKVIVHAPDCPWTELRRVIEESCGPTLAEWRKAYP